MPKVTQSLLFNCSKECAFLALTDYEAYPKIDPTVFKIKIEKQNSKKSAEIWFYMHLVVYFKFLAKLELTPYKSISWTMITGKMFKKNEGQWILKEISKNKTEVTYSADIELNIFAPKMVTKKIMQRNLPEMMERFHQRALEISKENLKGVDLSSP